MKNGIEFKQIIIKKITDDFAIELFDLLISSPDSYRKYFSPFNYEYKTIKKILKSAKLDQYFGIFANDSLIGFYMLRGFDEGYKIPSYGVLISQQFSNMGLGKLSLQHAISFCKFNSVSEIMLKVHPDNKAAKSIYESFGFKKIGIDDSNDNLIYIKKL